MKGLSSHPYFTILINFEMLNPIIKSSPSTSTGTVTAWYFSCSSRLASTLSVMSTVVYSLLNLARYCLSVLHTPQVLLVYRVMMVFRYFSSTNNTSRLVKRVNAELLISF
jgi:hypothetical protein